MPKLVVAMAIVTMTNIIALSDTLPKIFLPKPGENYMICALSDNARYAISETMGDQDVDNPQPMGGSILDLLTMQISNIPTPHGTAGVSDVADNGIVVGESGGKPAYYNPSSQTWTQLEVPAHVDGGRLLAVTPDAHYAVGYYRDNDNFLFAEPMYYDLATGTAYQLTNLPTVDLSGENSHQNVFYGISPDGRYVVGQMSQSYLMPVGLFSYVYDIYNQSWNAIGYNYNNTTNKFTSKVENLHFIERQVMSADGQWVTGTAYMVTGNGEINGGSEFRVPYRYNIADDQIEVYTAMGDHDIAGNQITNDGVVLGSTPTGNPYPTAVIRSGKYFISLDQVLSQVYGLRLNQLIGDNITGAFECLSADALTAVMVTYDNCYIIQMPEPFAEAASRVDLLANYSLSIPQNSHLSHIGEIKITFDREISCKNLPSSIELLKDDGTVVRKATNSVVSASNPHQVVVTFRTQTLEPGQKYTVKIPEGYIWLNDDTNIKSNEISLTYYGRENSAVTPTHISPSNGSILSELNYTTNYITVTFDSEIKVTENARCRLCNADTNTTLTTLMCTADGNKAFIYPDGNFMLYYGSNYRVEIDANSFSDLSGYGGNETFSIDYKGSYIRQISDSDIYLFNENCDTYSNFLFWSNETLQPSAIVAAWGFEPESTWLLVRDSEEDTDQALASHSMFTPAGQADEWLVIPQLFIPDDKVTLQFDAQSYKKTKTDRLKIYVYQSDLIYNYLSADITNEMRDNGDTVFDEILSPGNNEELLAGEWTRYSIKLDKYAGKNIYIAFVNENYDQSAIFVDNVQVSRDLDFVITNTTAASVVDTDCITVHGILSVAAQNKEYEGIELTLRDQYNVIDKIIDDKASISAEHPYIFVFDNQLPLTLGENNTYYIDVKLGDNTSTLPYSVKDLAFKPNKKVVLEEYTGATCGNCPLGIQAISNLENIYNDNFIPVTLRTYGNDMYAAGATNYSQYLGLDYFGAPSGRINRGDILYPMIQDGSSYQFYGQGIIDAQGNESYLWADAVKDEMAQAADFGIDFTVEYNQATRTLSIPVELRSALNIHNYSLNLFAVVTEDNLVTPQANYFSTVKDENLGEWGQGGAYATSMVYPYYTNDVARYVISGNAFNGTPLTNTDFKAGNTYNELLTATIPDAAVSNVNNCSVVVMLIDGNSHRIINANKAAFGTSSIESAKTDVDIKTGNDNITVRADGNISLTVHTTTGVMLASAKGCDSASAQLHGYRGALIVNVATNNGITSRKLYIK